MKLNKTPHCTLCAEHLVRNRDPFGNSSTRVDVSGVQICPVHDLVGPVVAYPSHVRDAMRGTTET